MVIPTNAVLKVVLSLLFPDSAIAQNVFFTLFENDGGSDDRDDVLDDLVDWMEDIYGALNTAVDSGISITGFKCYIRDDPGDDWDEVGIAFPTDGFSAAGDAMPNAVSALLHAHTQNPDVIAAKYFGGNTDTSTIENDFTGGAIASYSNAGAAWVDPFVGAASGSGFIPGVWSPTKVEFFPFSTAYSINAQVAYQRRRKPGVGI
jgi:hypothetical protein